MYNIVKAYLFLSQLFTRLAAGSGDGFVACVWARVRRRQPLPPTAAAEAAARLRALHSKHLLRFSEVVVIGLWHHHLFWRFFKHGDVCLTTHAPSAHTYVEHTKKGRAPKAAKKAARARQKKRNVRDRELTLSPFAVPSLPPPPPHLGGWFVCRRRLFKPPSYHTTFPRASSSSSKKQLLSFYGASSSPSISSSSILGAR
jgi:hypothetical protein